MIMMSIITWKMWTMGVAAAWVVVAAAATSFW